jgi:hypothetical protein
MLRFLSIAALASAAIIAAIPNSPASAAAVRVNVPVNARVNAATNTQKFAPDTGAITTQASHEGPKQRRWVCGPIVNYDGSPHCHWAP